MKKTLTVFLATLLVFSMILSASAGGAQERASALHYLGLFKGISTTEVDFALEHDLTREQGVILVIRLLGKESAALEGKSVCPFTDVSAWASPYVGWAYENGITNGTGEDTFGYAQPLTDYMFLTFILRMLGYTDSGDSAKFIWDDPYSLAASCDLSDGRPSSRFLRSDAVDVCFRALSAGLVSGGTLAERLIEQGIFTRQSYDTALKIAAGTEPYDPEAEAGEDTDAVVAALIAELYAKASALESQYTTALETLFNQASDEYTTLCDTYDEDTAYDIVVSKYTPQGQALEAQCDASVQALLEEYTQKLLVYTTDLSEIGAVRAQYNTKKADAKSLYGSYSF